MAKATIYHNPRCSKSRQTLEILNAKEVDVEIIEYLKDPPSSTQLMKVASCLIQDLSAMVRVKDEAFKAKPFDLTSQKKVCENLSKNPKILERPIVVYKGKAAIGRPPEAVEELF